MLTTKVINKYGIDEFHIYYEGTYIGNANCTKNGSYRAYTADHHDNYELNCLSEAKAKLVKYYLVPRNKERIDSINAREKERDAEEAKKQYSFANTVEGMKLLTDGNDTFYPTPLSLAGKMLGKIHAKIETIETVLEPSAGKGDLIDALSRYMRKGTYTSEDYMTEIVDTIESDGNLQCVLRGKGYRVIGDDFLSFESNKHYDLILMNPPFDNGDKHLLKAIDLQERCGGEIVCLLNAETIKNPYTNTRKQLAKKLNEHNAVIEYVKGGFKHAERKTDVVTAIVSIDIPLKYNRHSILDELQKAKEAVLEEKQNTELAVQDSFIDELIGMYNAEANAGRSLITEFVSCARLLNDDETSRYTKLLELKILDKSVGFDANKAYNQFLTGLRLRYWRRFLDRDELCKKMTSKMRDKYSAKVGSMKDFEFNRFNINQVLFEIQSQLVEGVEESIMSLFEKLSAEHSWYPECQNNIHYYNGWKTNQAHKVGMKAIIPFDGFNKYAWDNSYSFREYEVGRFLSDLERALSYLDKGEIAWHTDIPRAVKNAEYINYKNIHFTYFTCTFYKKGTCHVSFHKECEPLIDRLNIFASQHRGWLPPNYGKKHYADMDDEEKAVIDDFQGCEAYETVVNNPEQYLLTSATLGKRLMLTA